jgi:hypothetical protein
MSESRNTWSVTFFVVLASALVFFVWQMSLYTSLIG